MIRRSAAPASPAFERIVRGARFRDRIAIVVKALPPVIFQPLHDVALRDMKLARALDEIRYLPSRLGGHMPRSNPHGRSCLYSSREVRTLVPAVRSLPADTNAA